MRHHILSLVAIFLSVFSHAFSQVSVSGPTCVRAGIEYQYLISGPWSDSSTIRVCVTGGKVKDSSGSCIQSTGLADVRILWNDSADTAIIELSSGEGNASLTAVIEDTLSAGRIDSINQVQMVDSSVVPATLVCSVAKGGGCSPKYVYQWQESSDNVNWDDIAGGNSQNLSFSSSLPTSMYYRRRVTESNSYVISYSNSATVFLNVSTH